MRRSAATAAAKIPAAPPPTMASLAGFVSIGADYTTFAVGSAAVGAASRPAIGRSNLVRLGLWEVAEDSHLAVRRAPSPHRRLHALRKDLAQMEGRLVAAVGEAVSNAKMPTALTLGAGGRAGQLVCQDARQWQLPHRLQHGRDLQSVRETAVGELQLFLPFRRGLRPESPGNRGGGGDSVLCADGGIRVLFGRRDGRLAGIGFRHDVRG